MESVRYIEVGRDGQHVGSERTETGEMLPVGYVTYTGHALSAKECQRINALTREILASAEATGTVSSNLLNMRHREFLLAATGYEF